MTPQEHKSHTSFTISSDAIIQPFVDENSALPGVSGNRSCLHAIAWLCVAAANRLPFIETTVETSELSDGARLCMITVIFDSMKALR